MLALMYDGDAFVARGHYKPRAGGFTARVKASYGSFKPSGELTPEGGLRLTSEKTGGPRFTGVYTFMPMQG